jgi:hypothetical protein
MRPDESTVSGNDRGADRIDDLLTPVRDDLEKAAQDLGDAFLKARGAVRKLGEIDLGELMKRFPLAALIGAAGFGVLAGFFLWTRRR